MSCSSLPLLVYCAPGKHGVDEDDTPKNYVLWTNADGKPRRKSVLNPAGERITLMDPNSIEVMCAKRVKSPIYMAFTY